MMTDILDPNAHARVVGYGRVSTEDQEDNNSLEGQEDAYKKDKARYGWADMPFMKESGTGTSILQRVVFREVLRMAEDKEIDGIWVRDQDRLSRPEDMRDLAIIQDILVESGTMLVVNGRVSDLSKDADSLLYDVQGVLAKYGRKGLLRNMNQGRLTKARRGGNAGGAAPDGYNVVPKSGKYPPDPNAGKYTPDPERSDYIRLAAKLAYEQDYTLRQLRAEFDKRGIRSISGKRWSITHFRDIFFNEEYLGFYIYGKTKHIKDKKTGKYRRVNVPKSEWIIVPNAHEPLLSEEVFYGVQEKLRRRRRRANYNTHMLTAIALCPHCGSPLKISFSSGPKGAHIPKYECSSKGKGSGCLFRRIELNKLNEKVWDKFKMLLENPDLLRQMATPLKNMEFRLKELRDGQVKIQAEIAKIEAQESKLLDLYTGTSKFTREQLDAKQTEIAKNKQTYQMDYRMATAGIKALEEQPNDLTEIIKYMRILYQINSKLTYNQKVRLFRQFVYKVRIDSNGGVELELYKTPQSDVPQNFRSFPMELRTPKTDKMSELPVQTPVPNSLSEVLDSNIVAPAQVTYSSAHL